MLPDFSHETRQKNLNLLSGTHFDLCIIGGGITGAGVARDAASRGMSVCLIEQGDFASGTSSRSSKLIHGGIRYLENLEFGLVFEALNERTVLFDIAPHLVHPLTFLLPVYEESRVGMFKMGLGMWLYDALALMHTPKVHERHAPAEALQLVPALKRQGLRGAYSYGDAYMDDDRLVIETLRSSSRFGAICVNYVRAGRGIMNEQGRITELHAKNSHDGKEYKIRAKHFISTVGPWTDQFASSLLVWKNILRPSKGIHLTLGRERLPLKSAMVMATDSDKRIVFAIPREEMILIGTTDTDYREDPSKVHTEKSDVDYLLGVLNHYLPGAAISGEDVLASYAGVRPLVNDGSATESKTSREHAIIHTPHNVTFVAGGKYTTYRRMSRDIIETVLKKEFTLEERIKFARNQTREPINPLVTKERLVQSLASSAKLAREYGHSPTETRMLCQRYGPEARLILEAGKKEKLKSLWEKEADFSVTNAMCLHLRDFMLRRSPLFLARRDHGLPLIDGIAEALQKKLGWSDDKVKEEKQLYLQHMKFELGWRG